MAYTLTYQQRGNLVYLCPGILNLLDKPLPAGRLALLNGAKPQLFEVTAMPSGQKTTFSTYANWRGRVTTSETWKFGEVCEPTSGTAPAFDLSEHPAGKILIRWKVEDAYSNYISIESKSPNKSPNTPVDGTR